MMRVPFLLAAATAAILTLPADAQTTQPPADKELNDNRLDGAAPWGNPITDDRIYVHGIFNQLEGRIGSDVYGRWEGQFWAGDDFNKVWIKTEARYNADGKRKLSDGDHEILYDRPVSRFFNIQAGGRYDGDDKPGRGWLALGVQGLAPGFFNVEATSYVSGGGRLALKTNASWDFRVTQRLILQPQFETNWYSQTERRRGVGAGLSDIDSGLRLRYEISRKFAPYAGVTYQKFFGKTADLKREDGSATSDTRFVVGVRTWF